MSLTQNQVYPEKYDAVYREQEERKAQHLRLVDEVTNTGEQSRKIEEFIRDTNRMSVVTLVVAIVFIILFFLSTGTASAQDLAFEDAEPGYMMDEATYTFAEGFNCMNDGDFDRAIEWLTESISYNPVYASAYAFRAAAYYETGDYELALADFDRAIALSPAYESAYRWRGDTHQALGNLMLAEQDWNTADYLATLSA